MQRKSLACLLIVSTLILFLAVTLSVVPFTPTSAQEQPTLTATTTPAALFIEPLSPDSLAGRGCVGSEPGGTPTGTPESVCCVSGLVYFNGVPVEGAEVTIISRYGQTTAYTYQHLGTEQRPYYESRLSALPLKVAPNDMVTITASYSGYSRTMTYSVQSQGQQVDLTLGIFKE
jgi:hypothetical protein